MTVRIELQVVSKERGQGGQGHVFFGSFADATVGSVDEKLGKVTVKQEGKTEKKVVDFGDVMKP